MYLHIFHILVKRLVILYLYVDTFIYTCDFEDFYVNASGIEGVPDF